MSNHTPGPWSLEFVGNTEPSGTGHDLWDVMGPNLLVSVAENVHDRNARLIAAAPEMYEALRLAQESIGRFTSDEGSTDRDFDIADTVAAALAKANGEGSRHG